MQLIAYNTGVLGDMAKGERDYDAAMATSAATNLQRRRRWTARRCGSRAPSRVRSRESRAKAEIWTDAAGFDTKFQALIDASTAMMENAGTDLDAVKAGMGAIGKACGDCHDTFRGPKT